jgi:hypothetical protein
VARRLNGSLLAPFLKEGFFLANYSDHEDRKRENGDLLEKGVMMEGSAGSQEERSWRMAILKE